MRLIKVLASLFFFLTVPIIAQITSALVLTGPLTHVVSEDLYLLYILLFSNTLTIALLGLTDKVLGKSFIESYRFNGITFKQFLLTLGIGPVAMFVSIGISGFFNLQSLDPNAMETLEALVSGPLLVNLLAVGVLAPIGEELIFRGAIFNLLKENLPLRLAILLQGLIFGLYHMNLVQAPPTAVLGIFLGLVVYYTKSIWPAIIIHIVNNSAAILISQWQATSANSNEGILSQGTPPLPGPTTYLIIFGISMLIMVFLLKKLKTTSDL